MIKLRQVGDIITYYDTKLRISKVVLFNFGGGSYSVAYLLFDTLLVFESDLK